jgi:hypothetical protein
MKLFEDLEIINENSFLSIVDFSGRNTYSIYCEDQGILDSIELELSSLSSSFEIGMMFKDLAAKKGLEVTI